MSPQQLDETILFTAIVLPIWIVWRSDRRGVFAGAILQWILLIVAGAALSATVPDRGFNLDALWLILGWLPALLFCLIIDAIKQRIMGTRCSGGSKVPPVGFRN